MQRTQKVWGAGLLEGVKLELPLIPLTAPVDPDQTEPEPPQEDGCTNSAVQDWQSSTAGGEKLEQLVKT